MKRDTQLTRGTALRRLRRRSRDDRGQALVEFVLALPILLVIVFGIIEFASAWRTYQIVTNVAREGARVGVTPSGDTQTVNDLVDSLLVRANLNLARRTTTLSCTDQSGTTVAGMCGPLASGSSVEVQLDYQHTWVVLGPVLDLMCANCGSGYGTVTLSSLSVMRNE